MSQHIIQKFHKFSNYYLDLNDKNFINLRTSTTPDIPELLEIVAILETHDISYELTSQFDLKYL